MKTLVPLVLLMCCLCHISAGIIFTQSMREDGCCPGHDLKRVPKHCVADVVMTPSECKRKSIIIKTVHNNTFCIDRDSDWAKNLLKNFTKPSATLKRKKCLKKPGQV